MATADPEPLKRRPHLITPRERRDLMTEHADLTGLGLEIGPSHNPLLPKAAGYQVRIADYYDREGLLEKYEGLRPTHKIEEVDYVLKGGNLADEIPDRFDYVLASHVIEHTVCLVSFLQGCAALLRPGGVLSLAIPDHRYCFDRFRERTALGRVIDVYHAGSVVHTEGSVIEHYLYQVRKGGLASWAEGYPGSYALSYTPDVPMRRGRDAADGMYVDTHNWVFTPNHFRLIVQDLGSLGLVSLREQAFHDTIGSEFYVTLSAEGGGSQSSREELLVLAAREAGVAEDDAFVPDPRS